VRRGEHARQPLGHHHSRPPGATATHHCRYFGSFFGLGLDLGLGLGLRLVFLFRYGFGI
jgi:hypothetical protein